MTEVRSSPEFNAQVVRTVQAHLRSVSHETPTGTPTRHPRVSRHVGFLSSALAASTDPRLPWDEQPTGTAIIYLHDVDGNLAPSDDEVTIYSRRDSAFTVDTYVEFQYMYGKWQLTDANCSATTL